MVVAGRVKTLGWGQEIGRYHFRTLVYQLVKRVLSVSARFSPYYGAALVVYHLPVAAHGLAVRLHVTLLEIRSEAVEVLVIRQDGFRFRFEKICVPYSYHGQRQRNVLFCRSSAEMNVHRVRSFEKFFKV